MPQNTLSTHLGILARAELVTSERHSRSIVYRAGITRLRDLTLYLVRDCCGGRPELCEPLIAELMPCCAEGRLGMIDVIIYHNPDCGTSRNTLAMIRNAGIEPHVIEYLRTPPSRVMLVQLIERAGLTPRAHTPRRRGHLMLNSASPIQLSAMMSFSMPSASIRS